MDLGSKRIWVGAAVALAIGLALGACSGGGGTSAKDKQAFEDQVRQLVQSGPEDVEFFLDHVTDNVLDTFFNYTRDECRQNAQDCVGDPSTVSSLSNTKLSGDKASTDIAFDFARFHGDFVREGGVWKLNELSAIAKDIPSGVKAVDLELTEFAFNFSPADITDGNFAFKVKNAGNQQHEVIVEKIPAELDLQAALTSQAQPEGVVDIAFQAPIKVGESTTVVFDNTLEAGRYALICFFPDRNDPARTPHALKGMVSEFTIK